MLNDTPYEIAFPFTVISNSVQANLIQSKPPRRHVQLPILILDKDTNEWIRPRTLTADQ